MDAKALSSAIARFSAKFLNELDKTKSVVSSPLSAEFVLALLALGTTDKAHDELLTTLGISDDDSIRSSFASVSSKFKTIKGVTLDVANKVYVMEGGYDLQPQLKEDAVKVFDAAFEKVDFCNSAHAANLINTWVEDKTNKRIKDLITADDLDSYTRLVLINAIYFKGTWKNQFNKSNTMDQPFYVTASTTIDVPMMYKEDSFRYGISEKLKAQLLEMPYIDNEASMLVVLPEEKDGLDSMLQTLADGHDLLEDVAANMFHTKVQVTIPKFKIETEIDLGVLLPKMGIKQIFNKDDSGLTKILNANEPLYVSKGIQKAFIEVNEEGAKATASTFMPMERPCSVRRTPVFRADHPFLAVILANNTSVFFAVYRSP
uniref:Serine protease inhibitor 005 n=1 Tax=Chilo suppressalis TaxID=168631 RepID=J7HI16_CHISP|nr:serine protease inhibitor 005 [Chilo suppressalis]